MRFTFYLTQNLSNSNDYSIFKNLLEELWNREESKDNDIQIFCSEQAVYLLLSPDQFLNQIKSKPKTQIIINKSHCESLLNDKNAHNLQYSYPELSWLDSAAFHREILNIIADPTACFLKF